MQTPLVNHRGLECQVIPEGFTEDEKWNMKGIAVDYDLIETLDIKMNEGRSFSRAYNDADNFIINETAARNLNWKNPVGKFLTMRGKKGVVIGVAKDFILSDVHFKLPPTVLFLSPKDLNFMLIKTTFTDSSSLSQVLPFIKEQWNTLAPDIPFEHQILEYRFIDHYGYVTQMAVIFGAIGGFAILYSCIGLLGLTSYAVGRRTKEIGVRKVFGATIQTIFKMLISELMMLTVISSIIAVPLAYFFIDGFLKWGWSYRASVGIWVFVFAVVLTLVTSIASISYHVLKAARTNPIEALRYE
jgi:putative ABC transport system permease protein